MKTYAYALAACSSVLLAACAAQPSRSLQPAPIALTAPAVVPQVAVIAPVAPPQDIWSQLRASFVLDDCRINPQALDLARHFTRNPEAFESQLRSVLPLLAYVQDAAERAAVPGEFVLLPMIESGYNAAEPGRKGDPAGMWQIMPQTARAMDLTVNRGYDGRLDPIASTHAVMAKLKTYHDTLHDWRLVDMAFNAGEYKMIGLLDGRDQPAADGPLSIPVGGVTKRHLAKLMGMACVIQNPARFNVSLPTLGADEKLAVITLPAAASFASAAKLADLPLEQLRRLNPGYRASHMPADAPHRLLLPQSNAKDLLVAMAGSSGPMLAQVSPTRIRHSENRSDGYTRNLVTQRGRSVDHQVLRGESVLTVARRYHLDVRALRAWNDLASDDLQPGTVLRVTAPY